MPNRRRGNRKWNDAYRDGGKYYYEHDDRLGESTRRVSFKPGNNNVINKNRGRDWGGPSQNRFDEDDDMDMIISAKGRFNPYQRRGRKFWSGGDGKNRRVQRLNSPIPSKNKFNDKSHLWFKVTIPFGSKYGKDYILKALLGYLSPMIFLPVAFRIEGQDASFYVEDVEVANELLSASRKITTTDGYQLMVKIRPGSLPTSEIDDTVKEKFKHAMVKRFNAQTNALDLTKFYLDTDLLDCSISLSRSNVFLAIVDIIAENIPHLKALNLSDNKFSSLDQFSVLTSKLPELVILHLGKNKIKEITQLNHIQELKLEELVLNGNPVCDRFKDQTCYISEVRKRFPKVVKLDGVVLPPPIVFDIEEPEKLPPQVPAFYCSGEGQAVVQQFVQQFYQLYDASNRSALIEAYMEDAIFSYTAAHLKSGSGLRINEYTKDSRNLRVITNFPQRQRLLFQGKHSIINQFQKFPRTQHDPSSFTLDLVIFTPRIIELVLGGLFKEVGERQETIRTFARVFVIVPVGSGFCIVNDMLCLGNATPTQRKNAFKSNAIPNAVASPNTSVVSSPSTSLSAVSSPQSPALDMMTKQKMIEAVALQTGMNIAFSQKCLEDIGWDFKAAIHAFSEHLKLGSIPSEAFVK